MTHRKVFVLWLLLLSAWLVAPSASAAPICTTLTTGSAAIGDVFINSKTPDQNYYQSQEGVTGVGNHGAVDYTLMHIDVSFIPAGSTVTSATVTLKQVSDTVPGAAVNVHNVLGGWNPDTVTWDDFTAGYDPSALASFAAGSGSVSFDLTALTQAWVNGTVTNYGILLSEATGLTMYDFSVSENLQIFNVCYTPTPHPSLALQKTVSTNGVCPGGAMVTVPPGASVTSCYAVTNTGNTTVSGVVVTDGSTTINIGDLAPGGTGSGSSTSTATVSSDTSAVAKGSYAGATVSSAPSDALVTVLTSSLSLTKTVSLGGTCPGSSSVAITTGLTVTYCYAVTNTGGLAISGVTVSDAGAVIPIGSLAPGASGSGSQNVIVLSNTNTPAVASGTDSTGASVSSPQASAMVSVVSSSLGLDPSCQASGVYQTVNQPTWPSAENATCAGGAGYTLAQALAFCGADVNYFDYTCTDLAGGQREWTASFGCCVPPGGPSCSDGIKNGTETDVDCGGQCPQACNIGQGCTYDTDCISDYCVAGKCATPSVLDSTCINDGTNTTLHNAGWPSHEDGTCDNGFEAFTIFDAAAQCPGGVVKYFDYTCTDFALPPPYAPQRAWEADYSCCVQGPAGLSLTKTVSTNGTCPGAPSVTVLSGTPVVDCYTVTNTGPTDVSGVTIVDGGVTLPIGSLGPGQSASASRDETPTVSEDTHAVAQGSGYQGPVTSPPADAPITVVSPALTVVKTVSTDGTCPGASSVTVVSGTAVTFCYAVTNGGDTEIDNVTVTDAGVNVSIGDLGAGSSGSGSVTFTATAGSSTAATASGTVTATGTPITSGPSAATVAVVNPALSIQKTVSTGGACPGVEQVTVLSGTQVTYCYSVTNTGDTAVSNVVVNDDGVAVSVGDLGPGQTGNGSAAVTALSNADTFASATGTVTATGTSVASPPDDASVKVVTPALAISPTVSLNGACPGVDVVNVLAGTAVTICYAVTNTGDTPVDAITVNDSHYGVIPGAPFDLAPGQTVTIELNAPANNDVSLLASATGTVPATGTSVTSPQEPAVINVVSPDVDIDVTVSPTGVCPGLDSATVPAGTAVVYCYEVANNGDDTLSDITVTDRAGNVVGTIPSLAAGASEMLSSGLVTVNGNASISGTATGTDVYGFPVTDSDTAVIHALFASLQIQKTVSTNGACPGSELVTVLSGTQVTYCYAVTNSGGTAITSAVVNDNGVYVPVGNLAPGQTQTVSSNVTVTTSQDSYATANGINAPTGLPVASPPDGAAVTVVHPSVAVVKTVSTTGACPGAASVTVLTGAAVTYCYQVTDTGDTTLNDVTVADAGTSTPVGTLTPGQTVVVSAPFVAPSSDVDTAAVASAVDSATWTNVTSAPSAALVHVIHPAITLATTVSSNGVCPGVEKVTVESGTGITWCYVVTNSGDAPVTGIDVTDDHGGNVSAGNVTLAPGQSVTLSRHDTATSDFTLTATATGVDTIIGSPVTSNPDAAIVNVVVPSINIIVTVSTNGTCPGQDSVTVASGTGSSSSSYSGHQFGNCGGGGGSGGGTTLLACYKVINTGDDTLDNVVVKDQNGNVLSTDASLAAGASYSFSKSLAPVTADTTVTGIASATDVYGYPVTRTDSAIIHVLKANLSIVKTAPAKVTSTPSSGYGGGYGGCGGGGGQQSGTAIAYTITVTNIGQATASAPVVTDTLPSGSTATSYSAPYSTNCSGHGSTITCTLADLAPGASTTITLDTVTSVQNGTVTNTASVTSTTPDTDLSNNTSSASTVVQTQKPTRTCSYYASHPNLTQACLAALGGEIDLGWFQLRDEKHDDEIDCTCVGKGGDHDHRVETGISMVMGVLNCSNDHYTTYQKRPSLEQTKMAAAKELVAAICNAQYLGCTPTFDIDGMKAALNGTNASLIQQYTSQANAFNSCGTSVNLPSDPGPAMGCGWDDPTDCND